jgi:hypothetical protein
MFGNECVCKKVGGGGGGFYAGCPGSNEAKVRPICTLPSEVNPASTSRV